MNKLNLYRTGYDPITSSFKRNEFNRTKEGIKSFDSVLGQVIAEKTNIKFSKHAQDRMNSRNIKVTKEQILDIEKAIDKAEKKGVREALILTNKVAFIASIKNKTIITTISSDELKNNLFTNIDGAVII